jgi:DcuC family C4-dicarboxylate transporter
MTLALGILVIFLAVLAVYRRVDVRLALLGAALALGILGGRPTEVVITFLKTFSNERFVVPICTAMGFAYVLRHTGCDKHLVHLLLRPVRRVQVLLVPGTIAVGFLVNIPIVSQTSTAVTLGAVVIPLLLAARVPPLTVGAALLLGSSVGGELLNPGAPELRTIVESSENAAEKLKQPSPRLTGAVCVERIAPLNFLGLGVATAVFWGLSGRRREQDTASGQEHSPGDALPQEKEHEQEPAAAPPPEFKVNPVRAFIPLVPLVLLFLTAPPLRLIQPPAEWLLEPAQLRRTADGELSPEARGLFDSRLIGTAMLIGVAAASLAVPGKALRTAGSFFEGAGYGFTHIISLIVAANCFGEGVKAIGLADLLGQLIEQAPWLLLPAAGALPLGFAVLSGSGMASTQSLFPLFAEPALRRGIDPDLAGAVVALASAAGRTLSPVSAVTLMCGELTGTNPLELARRVAVPLLAAVAAVVAAAILMAASGSVR